MANITTGSYDESLFFYTYMPIGIFFFVFFGVPNNNQLPCPIHAFSTPTNE